LLEGEKMQEEEISFRPMQVDDLDDVLAIEKVSFPTPWSRHTYLGELLNNTFSHYIVLLVDGKVRGYGGMWLILDEAHITTIAVHPDFRNRRYGEALLKELIRRAGELGATRLTLEVRPSNRTAQHLYARLGFMPTGVRRKYYTDTGEDAIIMWKYLDSQPGEAD